MWACRAGVAAAHRPASDADAAYIWRLPQPRVVLVLSVGDSVPRIARNARNAGGDSFTCARLRGRRGGRYGKRQKRAGCRFRGAGPVDGVPYPPPPQPRAGAYSYSSARSGLVVTEKGGSNGRALTKAEWSCAGFAGARERGWANRPRLERKSYPQSFEEVEE